MALFDHYFLQARLAPAFMAVAPLVAFVGLSVSWQDLSLPQSILTLASLAFFFVFSDIARRFGRRYEAKMFRSHGKPSTVLLRHRDTTLDSKAKDRYKHFIASKVGETPPSTEDEEIDPAEADAAYERYATWLRENSRDEARFPILAAENRSYGFRRNLRGVKWPALLLNICVSAAAAYLIYEPSPAKVVEPSINALAGILAFSILHALYFLFAVSKESVLDASSQYARQLIVSCEAHMSSAK